MSKKGEISTETIIWIGLGLIAFVVIAFVFWGPSGLFGKGTKPIGNTIDGTSSDCDNDGKVDVLDPCPCSPQEPNEQGVCSPGGDECRKKIDDYRNKKATTCI